VGVHPKSEISDQASSVSRRWMVEWTPSSSDEEQEQPSQTERLGEPVTALRLARPLSTPEEAHLLIQAARSSSLASVGGQLVLLIRCLQRVCALGLGWP
jgi:hypothetical protein